MRWWNDEKTAFFKSGLFIIQTASLLVGVSVSAASAELTVEDKEHNAWEKEKVAILVKYQKDYGKIVDEWGTANAAAAPKIVGFAPYYAEKAKQVDSEIIKYFESTSFDATNRFKDNPGCAEGVKQFEPVLGKLKQGTITGLDASGSFGPMVLYRCALSAKVYEVTKKLEKLQAQKKAN